MSKPIDVINFRKRIKIALVKAFGGRCQHCKKEFPVVVFDFHHLNPEEKSFGLGNGNTTRAKADYAKEAKKCCMLCANCCNFDEDIYYATLEELVSKQKKVTTYEERMEKHSRKPDRETLKVLIRQKSFRQIGKDFGVSDNAIRKWCVSYNLPSLVSVIKSIPQEEWDLI